MTAASLYSRPEGFTSGSGRATAVQRIKRVAQYRRILTLLVRRDLKVRYAGSALGYVWTVLDPLLMSAVYWFIFVKVFGRNVPGENPYIMFLVMGQLMWAWFNGGVTGAARALRSESQMVRSSNVPRELWVLRSICSKAVEYFLSLPVVVIFALVYTKKPTWHILLLPLSWVMMFVLLAGLGLLLAPINILVRDTEKVIPIVLRLLFYMSPIIYSIDTVAKKLHGFTFIYHINPVVGPISMARATFFPSEFRWPIIWHSAIICVGIFVLGLFTFGRLERQVLKEV
ncbi:ABC-2 type transport system permease protein [Jatrophihabitans endophyticus]|uniref:Transport permease protein n=1 Tax=Jatrophihabitans endophyticus TaxID=1206085 RepID=A0A1M5I2F3_9ACTN|nr:ABC transporter permease [Jatrophihabitans endophyticus]SHG22445.1 ABC-2 type transport system permease protein [Jatrophihabitans endophyticus]